MELNYNRVELRGVAEDAPLLSHVNHGCAFYRFTLSVLRLSGQADKLPVIVPRPLLLLTPVSPGDGVHITGQLRSFNNKSGQGSPRSPPASRPRRPRWRSPAVGPPGFRWHCRPPA